ncbi:MAG: hypothetical protein P8Y66_07945 [Nitrospirota bacterium]|jgi:hypothetical protein
MKKDKEDPRSPMDELVALLLREGEARSADAVATGVLRVLSELGAQLAAEREERLRLADRLARMERDFRMLIEELRNLGYIEKVGDRRKPLKRAALFQEALVNLLKKKGVLTKKELNEEILSLTGSGKPASRKK